MGTSKQPPESPPPQVAWLAHEGFAQAGGFWWEGRLAKPPKHLGSLQCSAALYLTSSVAEEALLCRHPDPLIFLKFGHRHPVEYSALYFIKDIPQLFSISRSDKPSGLKLV